MIDVFVSYRTVDAGYGAAGCYEFFAARFGPDRVFRDCTSVLPGEVYPEAIEKALEETRACRSHGTRQNALAPPALWAQIIPWC